AHASALSGIGIAMQESCQLLHLSSGSHCGGAGTVLEWLSLLSCPAGIPCALQCHHTPTHTHTNTHTQTQHTQHTHTHRLLGSLAFGVRLLNMITMSGGL